MVSAETKSRVKHVAIEETKKMLWIAFYLFMVLLALAAYRAILEGRDGVGIYPVIHCLVQALVLAKVILIGNAMHIGDLYKHRLLAVTTPVKAMAFAIFSMIFSALEELVTGLFRGEAFSALMHEAANANPRLLLARGVVLFVFFVPLFALWAISKELGDRKLYTMFFSSEGRRAL